MVTTHSLYLRRTCGFIFFPMSILQICNAPFYSKKRVSRFSTQEAFQHLFVENFEWDSDPENEEEEGFLHVTPTNKTKTLFYMNLSYLKKKGEKEGNDILCL